VLIHRKPLVFQLLKRDLGVMLCIPKQMRKRPDLVISENTLPRIIIRIPPFTDNLANRRKRPQYQPL